MNAASNAGSFIASTGGKVLTKAKELSSNLNPLEAINKLKNGMKGADMGTLGTNIAKNLARASVEMGLNYGTYYAIEKTFGPDAALLFALGSGLRGGFSGPRPTTTLNISNNRGSSGGRGNDKKDQDGNKNNEINTISQARLKQQEIIRDVENGKIKLETNKQKGNYGEMKMDVHFESQGYTRISSGRVTSLDDKIVKGIDGVYENASPPPKFVIAEAKYGNAQLGNTKDGKQMGEGWINGGRSDTRLEQAVGIDKADDILLEGYDSVLIRISSEGNITSYKVK